MNNQELKNYLVQAFHLEALPDYELDDTLFEIAKTIQKQFLLDVYDIIGKESFDALQASIQMGEEFYNTTLKHLVPNYEELFTQAREKVITSFNKKEE